MSKKESGKVSLVLLKKLVATLEESVQAAELIEANKTDENVQDFIIEMAKGSGVAAAIAQEASMVVGDIRRVIRSHTAIVGGATEEDALSALFGALKGPGPAGSNN